MRGKYLVLGTLGAGVTLFAWQTISNVALPFHEATMKPFADSAAVVQAIRASAPENGVYFSSQGVLAAVSFTPDLADKTKAMGPMMAKQFVLDLVVALLLCLLVARIGVGRKRDTAITLGLAGLAAAMTKELSDWNWYGFAADYAIVNTIDLAISFALAGVVIAWIYRREVRSDAVAAS